MLKRLLDMKLDDSDLLIKRLSRLFIPFASKTRTTRKSEGILLEDHYLTKKQKPV